MAPAVSIVAPPAAPDFVRFPAGFAPRFLVTIDTEEEFDWTAPLRREGHGVATVAAFARFQAFCEGFGVVPTYVIDYPVAIARETREALGAAAAEGRAEIGAHLHPWVSPPFEEALSEFNSFAGNLPERLEREKVRRLCSAIVTNLGVVPQVYRAGRYGAGPHTAAILREAGLAVDSSVRARFDYSATGGPDYQAHPPRPYWLDRAAGLFELPVTTVWAGRLRERGDRLYPRLARVPKLAGLFARAGLLERIPLTPEGVTLAEAIRGIDLAVADGLPLLVFSFHSPSLAPGHTPYVRSEAELDAFYAWWAQVFAHLARRGVAPTCVREVLRALSLA